MTNHAVFLNDRRDVFGVRNGRSRGRVGRFKRQEGAERRERAEQAEAKRAFHNQPPRTGEKLYAIFHMAYGKRSCLGIFTYMLKTARSAARSQILQKPLGSRVGSRAVVNPRACYAGDARHVSRPFEQLRRGDGVALVIYTGVFL